MALDQITTGIIKDDAVTTAKILNDNITAAKIVAGAVIADVAADSVTASHLANDAVGTAQLANDVAISTSGAIAGTGGLTIDGATVFNDASADVDFRIESNGNQNMLFVDAGNDRVCFGSGTPLGVLSIAGGSDYHAAVGTPVLSMRQSNGADYGWDFHQDTGTDGDLHFHRVIAGTSTMAMTFARATGNVGIRTSSPLTTLNIQCSSSGSQQNLMFFEQTDAGFGWMAKSSSNSAGATLIWQRIESDANSGPISLCLLPGGNVGIGTATPGFRFTNMSSAGPPLRSDGFYWNASGNNEFAAGIRNGDGSNPCGLSIQLGAATPSNNSFFIGFFGDNNASDGYIRGNSGGVSYNTGSDYRLKENIVDMPDAIARLKGLKPRRFNFKQFPDITRDGFIAHEVSDYVPEAISGEKDAMSEAVLYVEEDILPEGKSIGDIKRPSEPALQGIDHSLLVPLLVGALQEAMTKIETLEAIENDSSSSNAALEARIIALEAA